VSERARHSRRGLPLLARNVLRRVSLRREDLRGLLLPDARVILTR